MKRILMTLATCLLLIGAGLASTDSGKELSDLDPILDGELLKAMSLTDSQKKTLLPKLDQIVTFYSEGKNKLIDDAKRISDDNERRVLIDKRFGKLVTTVAEMADKTADQIFDSKQEMLYTVVVVERSVKQSGLRALLDARIQRRLKMTKAQADRVASLEDEKRIEMRENRIDPEMPTNAILAAGKRNQEISKKYLLKTLSVLSDHQGKLLDAAYDLMKNDQNQGDAS